MLIWVLALNCRPGEEGFNLASCVFMPSPDTALVILTASLVLHWFSCDSLSNGLRGQWALTSALLSQTKNIFMCKCYMALQYPFMICCLYSEIKNHIFLHGILGLVFLTEDIKPSGFLLLNNYDVWLGGILELIQKLNFCHLLNKKNIKFVHIMKVNGVQNVLALETM